MRYTTIAIAIVLAASANAQWTVVNLHPAEATRSWANGVEGGQQVGYAGVGGIDRASLWNGTAGSRVDLHPAGASGSYALGVDGGQQVGYINVGFIRRASLWSGTAGSWVDLNPAGATDSLAFGVHGGQQVGQAEVGGTGRASLWSGTAATWVNLNPVGSAWSYARGVFGGQQVGYANNPSGQASLWSGTAGSWVDLNPAGATSASAYGVEGGQQVGFAIVGGVIRASLWTGSAVSWIDLIPAGATEAYAYGVEGGQQVGKSTVGGITRASLWCGTAGSWVDLHSFLPAGFSFSSAEGISQGGNFTYVVGGAHNAAMARDEALMWVSRSVAPASSSMVRGSVYSGNMASLLGSDDDRLVMRPGFVFSVSEPPVQVRLNATATTASPNGFSFSVESSASFGNAQQKVWLWNYVIDDYELLDTRLATTTDDVVTVTVRTNPSRFIQPGTLAIRALVSFRAVGPAFAYPWSGRIDKVWWNFPG